ALGVAGLDPVLGGELIGRVLPAAEEPHLDVRATHGERLFPLHGLEDGRARVLFGPYPCQATSPFGAHIEEPACDGPRHARFYGSVRERVSAEEVVLAVRYSGVVRVGRGSETHLVWIEALRVLHRQAILQCLTRVAADDVGDATRRVAEQDRHDLEARELVSR